MSVMAAAAVRPREMIAMEEVSQHANFCITKSVV
jgi:hypothetical protein